MAQQRYAGDATFTVPAPGPVGIDADTWWDAAVGTYETDPEAIAAVLPPPLRPGPEPLVTFEVATTADLDDDPDAPLTGTATFSVAARHDDLVGSYPLLQVVTDESRLVDLRERLGLPAKLGEITSEIEGQRISNQVRRRGHTVAMVVGTVVARREPQARVLTQFAFKATPGAEDPSRLDADPLIVHHAVRTTERQAVDLSGFVRLGRSPHDPVNGLPIRRIGAITLSQRTVVGSATVAGSVPAADFAPFAHQRTDHHPDVTHADKRSDRPSSTTPTASDLRK